jgi:hypothetical protein
MAEPKTRAQWREFVRTFSQASTAQYPWADPARLETFRRGVASIGRGGAALPLMFVGVAPCFLMIVFESVLHAVRFGAIPWFASVGCIFAMNIIGAAIAGRQRKRVIALGRELGLLISQQPAPAVGSPDLRQGTAQAPGLVQVPTIGGPAQPPPLNIAIACPSCGQRVSLPVSAAGKVGRCNRCKTVFRIPPAGGAVPAPAPGATAVMPASPGAPADGRNHLVFWVAGGVVGVALLIGAAILAVQLLRSKETHKADASGQHAAAWQAAPASSKDDGPAGVEPVDPGAIRWQWERPSSLQPVEQGAPQVARAAVLRVLSDDTGIECAMEIQPGRAGPSQMMGWSCIGSHQDMLRARVRAEADDERTGGGYPTTPRSAPMGFVVAKIQDFRHVGRDVWIGRISFRELGVKNDDIQVPSMMGQDTYPKRALPLSLIVCDATYTVSDEAALQLDAIAGSLAAAPVVAPVPQSPTPPQPPAPAPVAAGKGDASLDGEWELSKLYSVLTSGEKVFTSVAGEHKLVIKGGEVTISGRADGKVVTVKYMLQADSAAKPAKYNLVNPSRPNDAESGIYWTASGRLLMRATDIGADSPKFSFGGISMSEKGGYDAVPDGFVLKRGDRGNKILEFSRSGGTQSASAAVDDADKPALSLADFAGKWVASQRIGGGVLTIKLTLDSKGQGEYLRSFVSDTKITGDVHGPQAKIERSGDKFVMVIKSQAQPLVEGTYECRIKDGRIDCTLVAGGGPANWSFGRVKE